MVNRRIQSSTKLIITIGEKMIKTPDTFADDVTIVYSKNNCVKCKMTKNLLQRENIPFEEINIEESGHMDGYIAFLKGDLDKMAMPVVYPARKSGLLPWNDFQQANIKELASKI